MRPEAVAVAGFLAGYCGSTRRSYATDLRLFSDLVPRVQPDPVRRPAGPLELYGRWLEETGRMSSTVARRLSTLASFYKYCEQERSSVATPPSTSVGPRSTTSQGLWVSTATSSAPLIQAGLGLPRDHALASLLALNGLRISEPLGADIADLDFERGHRTLKILRKGGKHVTIPLAPRTSRAIDLYAGERTTGPIFLGAKGGRMTATPPTAPSSGCTSRRDRKADQPPLPPAQFHHLRP